MGDVPGHPNLKPWKPGQSGNPAGRPKRPSFESIVNRMLDEPGSDELTKREDLARRFVDLVTEGDMREMRELLSRVWPEVKAQKVEVEPTRSFSIGWRGEVTTEPKAEPEPEEGDGDA